MKFDELNVNLKDLYDKDTLTVADVASLFKDIIDGISREYPGGVDAIELGDTVAVKNAATYLSSAAHGLLSIYNNNKERLTQSTRVQMLIENRKKTFDSLAEADKYLTELKDQVSQVQKKKEALKEKVDELQQKNAQYDDMLKRHDELLNEIKEKQNIIANADERIQVLEREKAQMTQRLDELNADMAVSDAKLSRLEQDVSTQEANSIELSNNLARVNAIFEDKQKQIHEMRDKITEISENIIPNLEKEVESLGAEYNEKKKAEEDIVRRIEQTKDILIPDINARMIEQENELKELEQELSDKKGTLEVNEGLVKNKKGERQRLQGEISEQLIEKERLDQEVRKMKMDQADLEEQLKRNYDIIHKLYDPEKHRDVDQCNRSCEKLRRVVGELFSVTSLGYGGIDPKEIYQKQIQMEKNLETAQNLLSRLFNDYNTIREALEK